MALAILGNGQIENRSRCNYTLHFLQNTALLILRKMKIFNLLTKGQNKLCYTESWIIPNLQKKPLIHQLFIKRFGITFPYF